MYRYQFVDPRMCNFAKTPIIRQSDVPFTARLGELHARLCHAFLLVLARVAILNRARAGIGTIDVA